MRPIRLLLIYFAVVFLGGALLAPWLYWLAHWAAGDLPALSGLAANPFHRFLDRSLLALALLGLWPLLRSTGLRSWKDVGLGCQARPAWQILKGFIWGWASLAAVAVLAFCCGVNALIVSHSTAEVLRHLLNATWAAVAVAVLEELVFRGALFGILRRAVPWPVAFAASSAVYSAVHFIRNAEPALPVQWYSGVALLWTTLLHHAPLIPAFLTLFVAGAILAQSYQHTGALYFSIGLHAGWIFWLKSYRFLFHQTSGASSFWGTGELIDGWLSFVVLAVVFVLLLWRKPSQSPQGNCL